MVELINQIRFYNFISGVLYNQQEDPMCCSCKAFANTAKRMKEGFSELQNVHIKNMHDFPAGMTRILQETQDRMWRTKISEDAVGQKKAGNCRLPEGACFVKLSKRVLEKI